MNFLLNLNASIVSTILPSIQIILTLSIIALLVAVILNSSLINTLSLFSAACLLMIIVQAKEKLSEYSKDQLGNVILTSKLELFKEEGSMNDQVYDHKIVFLEKNAYFKKTEVSENKLKYGTKLGTVSCGDMTYKECIDVVNKNKENIIAELQSNSSKTYAVSQ